MLDLLVILWNAKSPKVTTEVGKKTVANPLPTSLQSYNKSNFAQTSEEIMTFKSVPTNSHNGTKCIVNWLGK